jgi:hypothetical protein
MAQKITKLVFLLLTVTVSLSVAAQHTVKKPKPSSALHVKFKPPAVKTFLGKMSGKGAACSAEEGKQIAALPLTVTDNKNNSYKVASYQFAYSRLGVTEDEETGKVSPAKDQVGRQFEETPLPQVWQSNINEQLHKGEELYFFDIIVLDKQGRRFFAPELKITIQ